jgi:hypothetical protein
MDYWPKAWQCPFFVWDDVCRVCCEGKCVINFPDRTEAKKYIELYCASDGGWKNCSAARMLLSYYERTQEEERRSRALRSRERALVRAEKRKSPQK